MLKNYAVKVERHEEIDVGDDFGDVQYRLVGQAHLAQRRDVVERHGPRLQRQLLRIPQHRRQAGGEPRRPPVGRHRRRVLIVRQATERRPVMLHSVEAVVGGGDDDGDGLALGTVQR